MSLLPPGSKVLVTGITGFIGSHVADQLLTAGYTVRGTSRTPASAQWLVEYLDKKHGHGKIEIVTVVDMTSEKSYDEAVKGVSGIIHLATVSSATEGFDSDPNKVITPAVASAINILSSANKEAGVRSVVLTGSSAGVHISPPGVNKPYVITEDTYNDEAIKAAWKPDVDGYTVYAASKAAAEQRFFEEAKRSKASYQVATVVPNANFGKMLKPNGEMSASTGSWPVLLYKGQTEGIFNYPTEWFVNVVDTARLHIIALIDPSVNGRRLFAYSEPFTWARISQIIKTLRPTHDLSDAPEAQNDQGKIPNQFAAALLEKHYGQGFIELEQSIEENIATLSD